MYTEYLLISVAVLADCLAIEQVETVSKAACRSVESALEAGRQWAIR